MSILRTQALAATQRLSIVGVMPILVLVADVAEAGKRIDLTLLEAAAQLEDGVAPDTAHLLDTADR